MSDCIANIRKHVRLIEAELVDIKGNQRNAESGTAACSSGSEPWLCDYKIWLKNRLGAYQDLATDGEIVHQLIHAELNTVYLRLVEVSSKHVGETQDA